MAQEQPSPEEQEALRKKLESMSPEELKEFQRQQCIFCQIASGKVSGRKVYEDERVIGVLDINPANPGHTLLLPKEHYMILPQLPEDLLSHLFIVAKRLSNRLLKALEARGTNIIVANGPAAGQRAQHFMIHIIPRKEGDGIAFSLGSGKVTAQELDAIQENVQKQLQPGEEGEEGEGSDDEDDGGSDKRKEAGAAEPPRPSAKKGKKDGKDGGEKEKGKKGSDELSLDDIAKVLHG